MGRLAFLIPPDRWGRATDRDKASGLGTQRISWIDGGGPFTPPMDLMYSAAVAEQLGWQVDIVDAAARRLKPARCVEAIAALKPDWVGVRLALGPLQDDLALVERIKAACPHTRIFLFGAVIQSTFHLWREQTTADLALYGEAEGLIPQVLALPDPLPAALPAGLIQPGRRDQQPGEWLFVSYLDRLPFPAWHLLNLDDYDPRGHGRNFTFYLLASRGCPKACTMCPYYTHQGAAWRSRSAANIVAELEMLVQRYGPVHVQTRDPNFGFNKKRLRELLAAIKASPVLMPAGQPQLRLRVETDLESLTPADIQAMADIGVTHIMTGVESTDPAVLKNIGQSAVTIPAIYKNIELCRARGIQVIAFYLVGMPDETWQAVWRTARFGRALHTPSWVSILIPYHDTEIRAELEREGLFSDRYAMSRYSGLLPLARGRYMRRWEILLAYLLVRIWVGNSHQVVRTLGHTLKLTIRQWRSAFSARLATAGVTQGVRS
jgi:anaerobic magnesium-protoporphyrin IX monomethyl ester cyclase